MNIGLDLDEVCCALMDQVLLDLNESYAINSTLESFAQYSFDKCDYTDNQYQNISIAEYLEALTRDTTFLLSAKPFDYIVPAITILKWAGHKIHIVTARSQGEEYLTAKWLDFHKIPVDSITHMKHDQGQVKGMIGKELNLDIFVDDYVPNVESMLEYSPKTVNFIVDKPWNMWYNNKQVKRIKDLSELVNQI